MKIYISQGSIIFAQQKLRVENFQWKVSLPGNLSEIGVGIVHKPYLKQLLNSLKEVGIDAIYWISISHVVFGEILLFLLILSGNNNSKTLPKLIYQTLNIKSRVKRIIKLCEFSQIYDFFPPIFLVFFDLTYSTLNDNWEEILQMCMRKNFVLITHTFLQNVLKNYRLIQKLLNWNSFERWTFYVLGLLTLWRKLLYRLLCSSKIDCISNHGKRENN